MAACTRVQPVVCCVLMVKARIGTDMAHHVHFCLQEQRDVDDLTEAMELLQLATALLKGGEELIPDSVAAISRRAATIASVAAELLPQLKTSRIREVLDHHGMSCAGCSSKADYLLRLVPLLRLPVQVVTGATTGSSKAVGSSSLQQQQQVVIEPLKDPFVSHATVLLKKPQEHVAQYMQRVFFRLLTLVPADYLAELQVACRRQDAKGRCISYLPHWVTAQAITIDKRTGMAHVSKPGGYVQDADASSVSMLNAAHTDSNSDASAGSCASGSPAAAAAAAGAQLSTEAFFVPGDAAGDKAGGLPAAEPHNRAGVDLCGFLHIRAIPPGVNLPTTGGSLTPQQQKALKDKAAEGLASGTAVNSPFKGVYYYFYTDIPALIDRIINTFDPEEADFLFEQLDGLTAARSLGLAGRLNTPPQKHCNEQTLLEGKAPPTCSVLVPNIGSCARAPLKPPRRRIPMDPLPTNLGLPPTVGTYKPRFRAKMPTTAGYAGRSLGDSGNDSEEQGSNINGGEGLGSSSSKGMGSGNRGRHRSHHHHHSFPITDRELSDRQLQEQMVKLARDAGRRDRDDPLVPLTLAGCAVASFGLYLASKRRRRTGLNGNSGCGSAAARLVLLGLGTGRLKSGTGGDLVTASSGSFGPTTGLATAGSGVSAAAPAAGLGTLGDGDEFDGGGSGSTKQKRQVVAALRVAMNNSSDTSKLEAALAEAEAADLDEASLLQRARALLDKRRKKDQVRAAAEKAKLRAQRKEEARKGRKAAAKQAAAATTTSASGVSLQRSNSSKASDCASQVDAGDLESDADSRRSAYQDSVTTEPTRGGTFMRILQLFGLGISATVAAASAESDRHKEESSKGTSRTSSSCLSRASSISALASAAATTDAVLPQKTSSAAQLPGNERHSPAGGMSNNIINHKPDAGPAAAGTAARACNSHPLQIGPSGSSVDEVSSMVDVPTSPSSPEAAAVCVAQSATPVTAKQQSGSGSGSTNSKRSKGKDKGSNQQGSKITGFQEVEEVPGWTKAPKEGAAVRSSVVKAVLDPFTAAAAKAASHPLLSTPSKNKHKAKQQAAVIAAAAGSGAAAASPAKRAEGQQQRGAANGVTAPVTPPAVAGAAAGNAIRSNSGGKHTGLAIQCSSQQQQQGSAPTGWTRRSAVSDDGSSSRPSTAGSFHQQQHGSLTPGKPKLNPKATPYQPSGALPSVGKTAAGAPAAMFGGYVAAGQDWQQQHGQATGPGGYALPMRGASPVGHHSGLMLGRDGYHQQQMSPMVNGGHGIGAYQQHSAVLGHQNAVDAALEIGPPGNGLMGYCSADYPGGYQFDQGLTSPNHHYAGVLLPELAGLVSPQHHQVNGSLMAAMQHQQHMHQQQLLELLSAAGTAEAAALGVRLASAGGSAPLNHGSSMDPSASAAAGNAQRSSYSSLPEVNAIQAGNRASGNAPPGFHAQYNAAGRSSAGLYGQGSGGSAGVSSRKGPGVLPLSLDDDQLPPGFSAEDYSTPTSETVGTGVAASSGYGHPEPSSSLGLITAAVTSPNSIPTTAPLGVFAADSSVWAPLAATAGSAASTVAAGVRSLWPATLATTAALPTDYSAVQHSYSRSQDLEVEVAAAATSANVAELVLGSSPIVSSGHVSGSVAADPQMSKLAKEIMAMVAE